MAIEKHNFTAARFDSDYSPDSVGTMSGDEDEFQVRASGAESGEDQDFDDADSGAGSDDFDLLELGETGAEFCQVGNSTCSVPFELYDLPNLEGVLSVDVWNECLTEGERLGLAKFLPDMDQETYMITLMELFKGCNFHFGSPLKKLFDMLRGGLCEPRVALYREGLNSFHKRKYYHHLKKYQNGIVSSVCQIRDAWLNIGGYSIEEKLRVLNIVKSQKSLLGEKEDMQSGSSGREDLSDKLWSRRSNDRKLGWIMAPNSVYSTVPDLEPSLVLQQEKYRKMNSMNVLKLGDVKRHPARQLGKVAAADTGRESIRSRRQIPGLNESEDTTLEARPRRNQIATDRFSTRNQGFLAAEKNSDFLVNEEMGMDDFVGLPLSSKGDFVYGRKKHSNEPFHTRMLKPKQGNVRPALNYTKKPKYTEIGRTFDGEVHMKSVKGLKGGNQGGIHDPDESSWHDWAEREALRMDPQVQYEDWNPKQKKSKVKKESNLDIRSHTTSSPQMSDKPSIPAVKVRRSHTKIRGNPMKNGVLDMIPDGDVTQSDSSDSFGDDESNPLMRSKVTYPIGFMGGSRSSVKFNVDGKKGKSVNKEKKESARGSDRNWQSYEKKDDLVEHEWPLEEDREVYSLKGKKKIKTGKNRGDLSFDTSTRVEEDNFLWGSGAGDGSGAHNMYKNRKGVGPSGGLPVSPPIFNPMDEDQTAEVNCHGCVVAEEDGLLESIPTSDVKKSSKRRKKIKNIETSDASFSGRNLTKKKRKAKSVDVADNDDGFNQLSSEPQLQIEESGQVEKQMGKKAGASEVASENETSEMPVFDTAITDMELENGQPKKTFTPITPTVHTDFSFSIIHLLSAVRVAMVGPLPEDSLCMGPMVEDADKIKEGGIDDESSSQKNVDMVDNSEPEQEGCAMSLTIQEIVNRVRSNPGDPCILETQEPLQDLVKGALKIFSSKSAPLGAKGWKALVVYERSKKGWCWIGPAPDNSFDPETIEEVTSPDSWGLPHKMLVKLVDSFANWLKSGQEILQLIGSLPPPPLALVQWSVDEKERFRDLRAQKSLSTIYPSNEEVREYFRKEEFLRYSIPDRAFSYTASDGKKSIVAPLRRCGGKPTSKARDHFMLKRDRPPHVTILCLVRDAAARLPGSIGTRADVCTLIRDSQYIVEEVTDVQINQIVSGALDRLHYERDPCVQFDGERKLWKYLHRDREEEDFEDDGTSSTKKWRRPKKDTAEPSDQGALAVAYHGSEEHTEFDFCSDQNVDPGLIDDIKAVDHAMISDLGQNIGDTGSEQIEIPQDHSMVWEAFNLNPLQENKLICQENSTNGDFDNETFGGERPIGF
ncbi:hypothetical protein SAY87_015854 [Trapa incisa]|uniref:DEUBAD domain-containing protein n=1 Tax=Trapa incisa TaxID=236973 RepID=A0AAN7QYG4_9MYRT|nr:hypothetical protein SAY87_015854 [Trapa incisa]